MRTFETLTRAFVLLLALAVIRPALAEDAYPSAPSAYQAGLAAIEEKNFDAAFKALEFAVAKDHFLAKFVLAQLYASDTLPFANHAKAFHLYAEIADRYSTIDPYLDKRSPYVARALVAIAGYEMSGLAEIGLNPDPQKALKDLDYASKYFDDMDAQLALVKIWLKDKDDPRNFRQARDLLLRLAREKGHPGAQATLAEMFYDGETKLGRRPPLALGFAILAVEGAADEDKLWIDSLYHQIFCSTAPAVRKRAAVIADRYRKDVRVVEAINEARRKTAIGKIIESRGEEGWGRSLNWECTNGETVIWPERSGHNVTSVDALTAESIPLRPTAGPSESEGEMMGLGLEAIRPAGGSE